jgi:tetratricopeptide (TPR) repeat protein
MIVPFFSNAQKDLDSLIDVGNDLYHNGQKEEALKKWEYILSKCKKSSSTYGTTLRNIQWYYLEDDNEEMMLKYHYIIMNSKLNDQDVHYTFGEYYKNYRYHSTMHVALYYAKKEEYAKALQFVNLADDKLTYYTQRYSKYMYHKVDLAFWKMKLYRDMGKSDSSQYALIHRALEYDYKYAFGSVTQYTDNEIQLAEAILENYNTKALFTSFFDELKSAIEQLDFTTEDETKIRIDFKSMQYEIRVKSKLKDKAACKDYLKASEFYTYLLDKEAEYNE